SIGAVITTTAGIATTVGAAITAGAITMPGGIITAITGIRLKLRSPCGLTRIDQIHASWSCCEHDVIPILCWAAVSVLPGSRGQRRPARWADERKSVMRVIFNVSSNDWRRTAMRKLVGAAAIAAALSIAGWMS
ncbi:hypothetical protein OY671_012791, partial [Metschnikowia pulcherrima]